MMNIMDIKDDVKYGDYIGFLPVGSGGCGQVYVSFNKYENGEKAYILKTLKENKLTLRNIRFLQNEIGAL